MARSSVKVGWSKSGGGYILRLGLGVNSINENVARYHIPNKIITGPFAKLPYEITDTITF